jgi:hypothetical protein
MIGIGRASSIWAPTAGGAMSDRDYYSPWNTYDRIRDARIARQRALRQKIKTIRLIDKIKTTDDHLKSLESTAPSVPPPPPPPPRVNEVLAYLRAELVEFITADVDHTFGLRAKAWADELAAIDLSQPGAWRKLRQLARQVLDDGLGVRRSILSGSFRPFSPVRLGRTETAIVPLALFELVVRLWELQDACREDESRE